MHENAERGTEVHFNLKQIAVSAGYLWSGGLGVGGEGSEGAGSFFILCLAECLAFPTSCFSLFNIYFFLKNLFIYF